MLRNALMTSQQAVAVALADKNIKVIYDHKGPKADLKNKIMYLRPLPDKIKEVDIETVRGDCDHELGHFLHTDPNIFDHITCPYDKLIFNAIEDGRVERLVSEEWYGCALNLERSGKRAITKVLRGCDKSEKSIRIKAILSLTLLCFGQSYDVVIKRLGKEITKYTDLVRDEINSFPYLEDSFAVLESAKRIAKLWIKQQDSEDKTTFTPKQELVKRKELANECSKSIIADARKETIRNKKFAKTNNYVAKTDEDKIIRIVPSKEAILGSESFFNGIKSVVPALRRRILIDHAGARYKNVRHQRKGKLDQRSLSKIFTGSDKVFYKRLVRPDVNMEFTLLIDCSGSMVASASDSDKVVDRLRLAAQCASALSITLDLINIKNECLGFTTMHSEDVPLVKGYDRVRPLRHLIIKDKNVPFHQCRYNFSELAYYQDAYENIDGESVLWAAQRALAGSDPMSKKVLVVFSDGSPQSYPEDNKTLNTHLKSVIKRVSDAGLLVIGVGLQSNHVKKFYENYLVCNDLSVFAEVFFEAYRRLLRLTVEKQGSKKF